MKAPGTGSGNSEVAIDCNSRQMSAAQLTSQPADQNQALAVRLLGSLHLAFMSKEVQGGFGKLSF